MREIALMDQTLKLMLKCVKKLSFDRMIGRTGAENHGWVPGHGALNAALMMDVILGVAPTVSRVATWDTTPRHTVSPWGKPRHWRSYGGLPSVACSN